MVWACASIELANTPLFLSFKNSWRFCRHAYPIRGGMHRAWPSIRYKRRIHLALKLWNMKQSLLWFQKWPAGSFVQRRVRRKVKESQIKAGEMDHHSKQDAEIFPLFMEPSSQDSHKKTPCSPKQSQKIPKRYKGLTCADSNRDEKPLRACIKLLQLK